MNEEVSDPDGFTGDDFKRADILMSLFLGLSRADQPTASAVFLVNGTTVAGKCVPLRTWVKELERAAMATPSNDETSSPDSAFVDAIAGPREAMIKHREGLDLETPPPEFISLTEVTIWNGSQRINIPLLRIRVADISAWSLGSLSE